MSLLKNAAVSQELDETVPRRLKSLRKTLDSLIDRAEEIPGAKAISIIVGRIRQPEGRRSLRLYQAIEFSRRH